MEDRKSLENKILLKINELKKLGKRKTELEYLILFDIDVEFNDKGFEIILQHNDLEYELKETDDKLRAIAKIVTILSNEYKNICLTERLNKRLN